jgi:putrescine---pyruvate transaminase
MMGARAPSAGDRIALGRRHQWLGLGFDESHFDEWPMIVSRAAGPYFFDADGNRWLDALCGQSAAVLGHNHPAVVDAIREQASELASNVAGVLPSERSIELAARLSGLTEGGLSRVFYCVGGSDANDAAIRLARQYWKNVGRGTKFKTIVRRHGYHGGTLATNAASGNVRYPHSAFEPLPSGFVHIASPYPYRCFFCRGEPGCTLECAEELRRTLEYEDAETVACFLGEPTMAAGGLIPPPPGYLRRVREICDEHEILMILDEVVTAFGRAGSWFEYQLADVVPDVVVLAKVLTGGHVPLGALLAREEVAAAFQGAPERRFLAGFTLAGTPLACAAALATIETIEREDLLRRSVELGDLARERLLAFQESSSIVGEIRVNGAMMGLEWVADRRTRAPFASPSLVKQRAVEEGRRHGVHFFGGPASVLLWIPPSNIDDAALDELLTAVETTVAALEREFAQ